MSPLKSTGVSGLGVFNLQVRQRKRSVYITFILVIQIKKKNACGRACAETLELTERDVERRSLGPAASLKVERRPGGR